MRRAEEDGAGVYTVRFPFVIYGFSSAGTDRLTGVFLLGRAPEARRLEPFCHPIRRGFLKRLAEPANALSLLRTDRF